MLKINNKLAKLAILAGCGMALNGCITTSEGQKSGVITHVTKKGMVWGTWQGELVRGGFDNGTGVMGKSFEFNLGVFRGSLVDQAFKAMNAGHPVTISYKCEFWVAPWLGERGCTVNKITFHPSKKN